jgi:hypothetical protein
VTSGGDDPIKGTRQYAGFRTVIRPLFALLVALLIRADEFCIGEDMTFHR